MLLSMFAAFAAGAAPAWRWVDANGIVHYSDTPVEGAVRIDLPEGRGIAPAASSRPAAPPQAPASVQEPTQRYTQFDIVSPAQQETFWNTGGNLTVQIALQPVLQQGHRLDILLDGTPQNFSATGTSMTLSEVFRGIHTIQAVILDGSGSEVLRSQPVQFMIQQTSLLNPNNPNGPRPRPN